METSNIDPLADIKVKLSGLLSMPVDAHTFVGWLEVYSARAKSIISPKDSDRTEAQRRDLLADLSRFQSDQACVEWANTHGVLLHDKTFYWWLNPEGRIAKIVGIEDTTRGIPRITNGIDVWMELHDGRIFKGHRDNLVYERRNATLAAKPEKAVKPKRNAFYETAEKMLANGALETFKSRYEELLGVKPLMSDEITAQELSNHIEVYMNRSLVVEV